MQPPSLEMPSLQLTEKAVNKAARGSGALVCGSLGGQQSPLPVTQVPGLGSSVSEAPCLAYHPGQWPLSAVGCAALSWGKGREVSLTYEDLAQPSLGRASF